MEVKREEGHKTEKRRTFRVRERWRLVIWDHRSVDRFLVSELRGIQLGCHVPQHQN